MVLRRGGLVFRGRRATAGQIRCAGESACGQSTSGSTGGGRCDSWSGLDRLPGVGVGEEKEQVRHCKPGYWSSTKKTESECRAGVRGPRKARKVASRQGRAGRAARTSQGEDDVSVSVFPLLGPVLAQVDNGLWWLWCCCCRAKHLHEQSLAMPKVRKNCGLWMRSA